MPEVVAVVGAGLMGAGIAQVAAQAGYEVRLFDVDGDSLDRGVAAIRRSVARLADKGVVTEDVDTVTARVIRTTSLTTRRIPVERSSSWNDELGRSVSPMTK